MRKNIIIAILASVLLCISQLVFAVPAQPGLVTITQPDGSKISVRIIGDEWFHYVTDENGNLLQQNSAGFYVKSSTSLASLKAKMANVQAEKRKFMQMSASAVEKAQVSGTPRIPVILVQFSDKSFSIDDPKTAFDKLLNEEGYSENGGTGSVLDYYRDQSRGVYQPKFDVMDVVTLSGTVSTYGSNDNYAANAIYEACQMLDSTVDFSQYDNNDDGKIDMILMYFAGYNEAEGGGSDTIWPHQYYITAVVKNPQGFDGVTLYRYFCTSELKGNSGTTMCGIGTTCHEFAHSLGLPDMYDTNYNYYGDGRAGGTYSYDVMNHGSYNNNGRTPPWLGVEELSMLGWMDSSNIIELTEEGEVTIPPVSADSPIAYKTPATDDGEYFLYECRPGTGWDKPLTPGLLVYHVDKCKTHIITWNTSSSAKASYSAYNLWAHWEYYNAINCSLAHPCYYLVPSSDQTSLYYTGSSSGIVYPGSSNVTTFTPNDWEGSDTGYTASGIAFNSTTKVVTFNLTNTNEFTVTGSVMNSSSQPISGVTITATKATETAVNVAGDLEITMLSRSLMADSETVSVTSDEDGAYSLTVPEAGNYIVTASKSGYVSKSVTLNINRKTTQNFYLLKEGEEVSDDIVTYPSDATWSYLGFNTNPTSRMCADFFPSTIMNQYAGKQIKKISFMIGGETDDDGETTTTGNVYALLDFGSERKAVMQATYPVANDWTTVDVSALDLYVTEGQDIFAGYALDKWAYKYPLAATTDLKSDDLCGYIADYDLESTDWKPTNVVFMIKLTIGDYIPTSETGYSYIKYKVAGYNEGAEFPFKLVWTESDKRPDSDGITWYFDDEPVSTPTITLTGVGTHDVRAEFNTVGGNRKVIECTIEVLE